MPVPAQGGVSLVVGNHQNDVRPRTRQGIGGASGGRCENGTAGDNKQDSNQQAFHRVVLRLAVAKVRDRVLEEDAFPSKHDPQGGKSANPVRAIPRGLAMARSRTRQSSGKRPAGPNSGEFSYGANCAILNLAV